MDYQTYQDAQDSALTHFQNGEYAEAMAIFDAVRPQFPGAWIDIDYFRSCLAFRLGDPARAYRIFDNLLEEEIWFSEDLFRKSPSYMPFQGEAEFEKRVAAHKALREQMGDVDAPVLHTRVPPHVDGSYPLLFHLHGKASNALAEIENWQAAVDTGWLVAVPQSVQIFWSGGGGHLG